MADWWAGPSATDVGTSIRSEFSDRESGLLLCFLPLTLGHEHAGQAARERATEPQRVLC